MKKVIIGIIIIIIALMMTNVYASATGQENILFMIKKIFTENEILGEENLLSDKEITISYSNIEIAEKLKIQIQKIVLEENVSKLYLYIQNEDLSENKLRYKIYDENNNLITEYKGNQYTNNNYLEQINIKQKVNENEKLKLEILNNNLEIISSITIDLENKELLVNSDEIINKQSEVELKQYLGAFAVLNDKDFENKTDKLIYIAELINNDIMKKQEYSRKLKNNTIESFCNEDLKKENGIIKLDENSIYNYIKYLDDYQQKTDPGIRKIGICFDINDILYKDGIYTVKFVYCLSTYYNEEYDENVESLPKYEATAKLMINSNTEYSKYKIIDLSEGKLLN